MCWALILSCLVPGAAAQKEDAQEMREALVAARSLMPTYPSESEKAQIAKIDAALATRPMTDARAAAREEGAREMRERAKQRLLEEGIVNSSYFADLIDQLPPVVPPVPPP